MRFLHQGLLLLLLAIALVSLGDLEKAYIDPFVLSHSGRCTGTALPDMIRSGGKGLASEFPDGVWRGFQVLNLPSTSSRGDTFQHAVYKPGYARVHAYGRNRDLGVQSELQVCALFASELHAAQVSSRRRASRSPSRDLEPPE